MAIFILAIGLAFLFGLIKNYVFLYQQHRNVAVVLIILSALSLLIPDYWVKFLVFLFLSCITMFIATTIKKEQSPK